MAINEQISQLAQRTLALPSGSQADQIEILDATDLQMNAVTGTNKRMVVGDFLLGFIATANSNLGITETSTNTQPGILLTVPTTGLVITQHSGAITSLTASSIGLEPSGGTGSMFITTGTTATISPALTVTGSDLAYGVVGLINTATVTGTSGFTAREQVNPNANSLGIASLDALNVTSNSSPSLSLSAPPGGNGDMFNGIAFKAPSGSTWTHNGNGGTVSSTSGTQTTFTFTLGAVTAGDLVVVSLSYYYVAATITVSDGTNTYPLILAETPTASYNVCRTYALVVPTTVPSGYTVTATFSTGTYYAAMVVDDYTVSPTPGLSINWTLSDSFIVSALSGSPAITFAGSTIGQKINLVLGSNGYSATWPAGITGVGFTWPPTLSGTGLRDEFLFWCIASNTYLAYNINGGVGF
jgi:hypothetical protein